MTYATAACRFAVPLLPKCVIMHKHGNKKPVDITQLVTGWDGRCLRLSALPPGMAGPTATASWTVDGVAYKCSLRQTGPRVVMVLEAA